MSHILSLSQLLVGASGARVRSVLAAVQGGVSHAAVVGVHVHLGPHAAGLTALCPGFHLRPHLHVLLHRCRGEKSSTIASESSQMYT